MNKKILITGSSGFIGKNLTNFLLNKNFHLWAVLKVNDKNKKFSKRLKKNYKNFHPIFFKNINELEKKISKLDADTIINLASKYLRKHNFIQMVDLIKSNILFTTSILQAYPKNKLKKYINLSSVMMFKNSKNYLPQNLYAATKKGFLDILKFYETENKKIKFYNLFLHDIYGKYDDRDKIINIINKSYKKNKVINIYSKKLSLNLLNVNDINRAIEIILYKKIRSGDYIVKSKKFTNITRLLKNINKKIDKKIKYQILNKKIEKKINYKIKMLPFWKQKFNIEKDLIEYLDEDSI